MQFNKDATTTRGQGAQLSKPRLLRIYTAQLIVLLLISAVMLTIDLNTAISALAGGLISIAPNAYFARWAFRYTGAKAAAQVAQSFYRGEAGKFLFTAMLFAGVFALLRPVDAIVVFSTYLFMLVLNWILVFCFIHR